MSFDTETVALEAVAAVRPLLGRIKRCDKDLARQLARSATSMAQNLGEGRYSDPGTARARFHSAAGSAHETRVSLRIAIAWGYVSAAEARASLELIDRVVAMCFRLTRPKAR